MTSLISFQTFTGLRTVFSGLMAEVFVLMTRFTDLMICRADPMWDCFFSLSRLFSHSKAAAGYYQALD